MLVLFTINPAQASIVTFDFMGGGAKNKTELTFNSGGITLIATGKNLNGNAGMIHWAPKGLGIRFGAGGGELDGIEELTLALGSVGTSEISQADLVSITFSKLQSGDSYTLTVDGGVSASHLLTGLYDDDDDNYTDDAYAVQNVLRTGKAFTFSVPTTPNNDYRIAAISFDNIVHAPEPGTFILVGIGLLSLAVYKQKKQ